jgi:hypothetical protein
VVARRQEVGTVVVALGEDAPEEAAELALADARDVDVRRLDVS